MRSTVNTQAALPAAAPSQRMSWLPHWMSMIRVLHEHVHDARGLRAAVEDVAHDVEPVHGEALYELGESAAMTLSAEPVAMTLSRMAS